MKLRVYAREGILVPLRDVDGTALQPQMGQVRRYVGRELAAALIPPATKEPYEVDTATSEGEAAYLVREVKRGDLFAADKPSADFCGADLLDVVFADGAYTEKPKASAPRAQAPKKDGE